MIDRRAAQGFSVGAEAYERGRPSYPAAALDRITEVLSLRPGRRVLDLAAGTGKLTRLLLETGADVVAVEPVTEMAEQLLRRSPSVEVLDGTAEALPLADRSIDAVTVAQAFHWFDPPRALAEIARVLRPSDATVLALVWNSRDESEAWVTAMTDAIGWRRFEPGSYGERDWSKVVTEASAGLFEAVEHATFAHAQRVDRPTLLDRTASISYVATMNADDRKVVLDRVSDIVADFPEEFDLPYCAHLWTFRLGSNAPS